MMLNSDPRDIFVYSFFKLIINSFFTCLSLIRLIYHVSEEWIEKSVPRASVWHHEGPLRDVEQ